MTSTYYPTYYRTIQKKYVALLAAKKITSQFINKNFAPKNLSLTQREALINFMQGTPLMATDELERQMHEYMFIENNKMMLTASEKFWIDAFGHIAPTLRDMFSNDSLNHPLDSSTQLPLKLTPDEDDAFRILKALIEYYVRELHN